MAKITSIVHICRACGAHSPNLVSAVGSEAAVLWDAGWRSLTVAGKPRGVCAACGGQYRAHIWVCPACAATLTETRVLLALRGVRLDGRSVWYLPLRYHVEHTLWRLRSWWRRT